VSKLVVNLLGSKIILDKADYHDADKIKSHPYITLYADFVISCLHFISLLCLGPILFDNSLKIKLYGALLFAVFQVGFYNSSDAHDPIKFFADISKSAVMVDDLDEGGIYTLEEVEISGKLHAD